MNGPVVLVPTMGAFHEGHLQLMRTAGAQAETVITSIFVNPTQFGPSEDFQNYPRDEANDISLADSAGVDAVFAPSVSEVYPEMTTTVHVRSVTEGYEGTIRPGHFDGVATIVLKLFCILRPDMAVFGLKDLQQCAVIERMIRDLNVDVNLQTIETVREADGLAMSSRNRYLSEGQRELAARFPATLAEAARQMGDDSSVAGIERALVAASASLAAHGFQIDYVDLVDRKSMKPVRTISPDSRIIGAVRIGALRLIDNMEVRANS